MFTPSIKALNALSYTVLSLTTATTVAAELNSDPDDEATYVVKEKDGGHVVAVYDGNEFVFAL